MTETELFYLEYQSTINVIAVQAARWRQTKIEIQEPFCSFNKQISSKWKGEKDQTKS